MPQSIHMIQGENICRIRDAAQKYLDADYRLHSQSTVFDPDRRQVVLTLIFVKDTE